MNELPVVPIQRHIIPRAEAPETFRSVQAKQNAIIAFAKEMQDWPLLEDALDAKIADQVAFVGWWDEKVGKGWGGDRSKMTERVNLLSREDAEASTGVTTKQVSRWRKRLADQKKYRDMMILAAYRKAELVPPENHRAEGTGENEWFTPERYIQTARDVMGDIDLDPATHPAAQQTVQATKFFTRQDDGLTKQWGGRVWLNPPYAQPLIGQFVEKLVAEIGSRRVEQAILLTHNYTDTAWFHLAEASAELICFTKGRIRFVDADGEECSPTQGQALFYYGVNREEFRAIFGTLGFVR